MTRESDGMVFLHVSFYPHVCFGYGWPVVKKSVSIEGRGWLKSRQGAGGAVMGEGVRF